MLILLISVMGMIGCEKEAKEFGDQVMHPNDNIVASYDSSFQLNTFIEKSDSFRTLYASFETQISINNPNVILGNYLSPHFGRTKAGFISQIYKSDSISFNSLSAVNAALYFRVDESYGESQITDIHVYKLNKGLTLDQTYYSNTNPAAFYSPEDKISEQTEFQGDSIIKVTLSQSFADFLASPPHDSIMGDISAFLEFFPGIYVEMEASDPGFFNQIKITNDTSRLELGVRNVEGPEIDTIEYPIPGTALRVNTFEHNVEEASHYANIKTFLDNDPSKSDSILFINSLDGYRAKVEIPESIREEFSQDTNFLARAEIELKPLTEYDLPMFPEAVSMHAYVQDTTYLSISNSQFFDGKYDEDTKTFSCNITDYMQAYINGEVNNFIYIQLENYQSQPGQLIISGKNHPNPIKLKIKYFKP